VALSGQGVLETFMGLLNRTYAGLDAQHKLKQKFGISDNALLEDVAKKLGAKVPVQELLQTALGGPPGAPVASAAKP
jgi:hypothetical protein